MPGDCKRLGFELSNEPGITIRGAGMSLVAAGTGAEPRSLTISTGNCCSSPKTPTRNRGPLKQNSHRSERTIKRQTEALHHNTSCPHPLQHHTSRPFLSHHLPPRFHLFTPPSALPPTSSSLLTAIPFPVAAGLGFTLTHK
ncbi:hypothetical protein E2C01_000094 [Portunus trituberculatus]|uniref:Uncharacterized protein n=1 Tax=Portunus trituberculatus TaxID=210409 RepID=A0A5B7CD69_PORTR|nr:hypothetical protein [Portunus trituberculatus]